jgi:starch-binding outer membrane protein, SusD/RagB family
MKSAYIIFIAASMLTLESCSKFVDTPIPSNSIVPSEVFSSDASTVSALLGAYASVQNESGELSLNGDRISDEMVALNASGSSQDLQDNTYTPNDNFSYFDNYYKSIYIANALIEGVNGAKALSAATVQQVKGESLFLRAFCHFQLMNIYGQPPLILTTDVRVTALLPNTPRQTTMDTIISDLKTAYSLVADDYPSADRVRANKAVISAFLAKVYLYNHQWSDAVTEANRQLTNTAYSLNPDLTTVFQKQSPETIWQLWNQSGFTSQSSTYIPTNTDNIYYYFRPGFLQAFETGDQRMAAWIRQGTGASTGLYYPYKYKQVATSSIVEYEVQMRLAEQYLIRAEAKAHLNDVSGAMDDVNAVRNRAGLTNASANTVDDALLAVEQERRVELFTEVSTRWFDLVRTGRADYWMKLEKPATWQLRDTLLPYSTTQLIANPNLQQNVGY